ncbi:hypothetical protein Lepto7375DRAFT_3316 [Leptolyngbya sp. PCC 7375]|nr:hypothetical protein Lepto7375DRAFT_3316 [Leptolyngbya sp. PCC 7375]
MEVLAFFQLGILGFGGLFEKAKHLVFYLIND